MQMDAGLDTGDVLAVRKTILESNETGQSLHDRLSEISAQLLADSLPDLLSGTLQRTPQPKDGVTYARMLAREDGKLDWTLPASTLARRIRAFYPWPGAFTSASEKSIKLFPPVSVLPSHSEAAPGTVVDISANGVRISTGSGDLLVEQLQLQGRRRMSAGEFANGRAVVAGDELD
jgi:methionyl-tRNA formyltransferase